MNVRPVITVITPYYNNAETIISSLNSVLSQSYKNIQYILVDDGSSDFDYEKIENHLKTYPDAAIIEYLILRNKTNLGTVKALNYGLKSAKGEIIYTLAADDYFADDNVLLDWTNEFIATNAQIITAKRAVYDNHMETFKFIAPNQREIEKITLLPPLELFESITVSNIIFGCCTAYTKACYDSIGGFDERYRLVEDYPMNLKLLRRNVQIEFFDRVVVKYRLGGISNAGNINRSYLRESDKIFFHEAFPYTKKKGKTLHAYLKWRRNRLLLFHIKKYQTKFKVPEGKGKFKFRVVMMFFHPIYMLKKIKKHFAKKNSASDNEIK